MESMSIQVEVNVQEHFSQFVESGISFPDMRVPSQISRPTIELSICRKNWNQWFQSWLEILQPDLSLTQAYELSLRLTDDTEIQVLNSLYRQQDRPTDVLAFATLEVDFPQPEGFSSLPVYLGDIVISVDTAYRQAAEHQHSLEKEIAWLASHGLLHLLGWDHPDEHSLTQMLNQQDILLQAIDWLCFK